MTQEEALADALGFLGCIDDIEDGEPTAIGDAVIEWGDAGHDGPGWYIWCGEYPEEGSVCVSNEAQPFPALLKAIALQAERDSCGAVYP